MIQWQWIKEHTWEDKHVRKDWYPGAEWMRGSKQSRVYRLLLELCQMVVSALVPLLLTYDNFYILSLNRSNYKKRNVDFALTEESIAISLTITLFVCSCYMSWVTSSLNKIDRKELFDFEVVV